MTAFLSGRRPAMNFTYELARRVSEHLGEPIVFVSVDSSEPAASNALSRKMMLVTKRQVERGACLPGRHGASGPGGAKT